MTGRSTPDKVFRANSGSLARALGCIASERLSITQSTRLEVGAVYTRALNRNHPVVLRGDQHLQLVAGQRLRIVEGNDHATTSFRIELVEYWYVLSSADGREVLAFHWTPEAALKFMRTTPHLHVGSANIAKDAPLTRKTFNKLHIPTGQVSIVAIVRFLIEELKVHPRHSHWSEILDEADLALAMPQPR